MISLPFYLPSKNMVVESKNKIFNFQDFSVLKNTFKKLQKKACVTQ